MIYKKFKLFLEATNYQWTKWFIDKLIDKIKNKINCEIIEEEYHRYSSIDVGIRKFTIKSDKEKEIKKIIDNYADKTKSEYFLSYDLENRGNIFSSSKGELILRTKLKKSSTRIKPPKYIYHQTDPSKIRDILQFGLKPKSSKGIWDNVQLKYPDSLFFSTDKEKLFYKTKVTLKIDTELLDKSVKFWSDYNLHGDNETKSIKYIMTNSPIPASCVVDILDQNGEELEYVGDDFFFFNGKKFPK
jgi:hypothetical protein